MDAIKLLDSQHDEVSTMFKQFERASSTAEKGALAEKIADALAMHTSIEEKIFYPAIKAASTEDILLESVEEHLSIKRVLADIVGMQPTHQNFDSKVKVCSELVEHHVGEERSEMFPKARKILSRDQLEAIGEQMEVMANELLAKSPRFAVKNETDKAASI